MTNANDLPWVCCQIGSRRHYEIPRILHAQRCLKQFATDVWVPPGSIWDRAAGLTGGRGMIGRFRQRFHPALANARVKGFNASAVAFEARMRLGRVSVGEINHLRNGWFGSKCAPLLQHAMRESGRGVLFSFSYAAGQLTQIAKRGGWRTILAQIDPAKFEDELLARLFGDKNIELQWRLSPAALAYWASWRRECEHADHIVVNSNWTRSALIDQGIDEQRICIIPLSFQPEATAATFDREYPHRFTADRPLRVLFLGQIAARKGVLQLVEAARSLAGLPVKFLLVGPEYLARPTDLPANIEWRGPVGRAETHGIYKSSDVFILPTFSDGFAITQLEALGWKLPLIVSPFCGDVVEHGTTGWKIEEVTAQCIAESVREAIADPQRLARYSAATMASIARFAPEKIARQYLQLAGDK